MEIRQLRNVVALAEYRYFGKAAAALNLSPSALSISVKNLEDEVGTSIFVRLRKDIVPTDFGAEFLVRARSVLREVERTAELVRAEKGNATRVIQLGIDSLVAGPVMKQVTPRFAAAFPNARLEIDVATGHVSEAQRKLSSGDWDLGVVLSPDKLSIPSGFTATICARLTSYAYARKGHPLALRQKISLEALARQRWVLSTRTAGQAVIAACAKVGLKGPSIVARVNPFEPLRGLVESTDWVTILPSEIVDRHFSDSFVRLYCDEFQFRTNLIVLHARDLEMTLPARSQIEAVCEVLRMER